MRRKTSQWHNVRYCYDLAANFWQDTYFTKQSESLWALPQTMHVYTQGMK